ncbi:hypothetical protein [Bradyrhizobium guangzhouense]|uniref:Uncharacterized protein n=1 Tax=Bradyrhizobium guangzhouense TaxID=1325095 RepID=A0AAE6CAI4_9BRAD|nr:hypothetical protein [Bradyrhizobium guangzhouense]QAU48863.1 hypothetical protein XH91_28245 [Bradyrhizobium guangzhouense]
MLLLVQLLSFAGILAGLISLVRPLRVLFIRTRRTALGLLAACFATFLVSAAADGASQQRNPAPQQVVTTEEPTAFDDGCKLAGAIPNCEAEVAKSVAKQAALPKPAAPPPPEASRGGGRYAQCDIFLEESLLADKGYGSYDGRDADNAMISWKTCKSGVDLDRKFPDIAASADRTVENAERRRAESVVAQWRAMERQRELQRAR